MAPFDMRRLDITKQNIAVENVLERTENPRHRYLLQAYLRHRYLESAGRYERSSIRRSPSSTPSTASA
jgi:hypothetical protein